jgi:mRNA-degrading endonuclease RelE of RelBE toxin-antitoxin system
MKQIFDVEFLPEAEEFMESLDEKAREKVYYNIRKSQYIQDRELFKKLNDNIWEFYYINSTTGRTGFLHFGIIP